MSSNLKLSVSKDVKLPRFLQPASFVVGNRPHLPVDDLEGEGTALDTVHRRPGFIFKTYKKISKKVQEAEEWVDFIQKKQGIVKE